MLRLIIRFHQKCHQWGEGGTGLLGRRSTEHFRMRVQTMADVRTLVFACGHIYLFALLKVCSFSNSPRDPTPT